MKTFAIKTGKRFTAVKIDTEKNQCLVLCTGSLTKSSADGHGYGGHLFVCGTNAKSIKRAAQDGAGESFATLKALKEAHPIAERRMDFDC